MSCAHSRRAPCASAIPSPSYPLLRECRDTHRRLRVNLFHRRLKPPLRYFLYISDTKLDMLFGQIDPGLRRRVSAEAKVDLKLASLVLRQSDRPEAARMANLRVVEHYLDTHHQVGTVRAPGHEYFRGSMAMQWGWLWDYTNVDTPTGGRDTVFFKGRAGEHVVVLAGSRRHVLGEQPAAENSDLDAGSHLPYILAYIAEHISGSPELHPKWAALRRGASAGRKPDKYGLQAALEVDLRGPEQHLEFLAIPLAQGDLPRHRGATHGTLATPLYVAITGMQ